MRCQTVRLHSWSKCEMHHESRRYNWDQEYILRSLDQECNLTSQVLNHRGIDSPVNLAYGSTIEALICS
ncbi:hypothetical protein FRX31_004897 [Thalictrum thalictroides]|uniref:Uncharacterized protein n=1 Tax=Thalictrum thalictroides TaxID=46969 RepID=A0A7J6X970_THATH|nr:hypothetical protein FRX31_004897 [Thalictrum thalictroides]